MDIIVKFKNLLVEALKDNKRLIIGLYILFIIVFIASFILSGDKIWNLSNTTVSGNGLSMNVNDAIDLFIHNTEGGIVTYIGSIFFAIPAIVVLIYNGISLGTMGQFFNHMVPNGSLKYIVYLIPHGIFEITATVLQSVAGVLLFLFIWRFIKTWRNTETHDVSDSFEKTKKDLIQSIVLMIFSIILLLIAAPIEAYVSIPFSEFILGF